MLHLAAFSSLIFAAAVQAAPVSIPSGYTWNSPVPFSALQELGPDAWFATFPADVTYDKAQFELVVVHTSSEAVVSMKDGGADPESVARVTFLGLSNKPTQINKTLFMGGTEARLVFESSIPRPHTTHVYQKYLANGSLVSVGLRDFGGSTPGLIADVLRSIAETFVPGVASPPQQ